MEFIRGRFIEFCAVNPRKVPVNIFGDYAFESCLVKGSFSGYLISKDVL